MKIINIKIYIISKKIRMKELNLKSSENIDIDIEKIKEIYDEANFFFEEQSCSQVWL